MLQIGGQKAAEHMTLRQARGLSGKFPEIIFSVFNSLLKRTTGLIEAIEVVRI